MAKGSRLKTFMELASALKKLEDALAEHYGWSGHPFLRQEINTAIAVKAGRLGITPSKYCQIAASSQSELLALVEETAMGDSYFFREPEQFEWLRTKILPELMHNQPPKAKLRLWSATCSTGEEAYSLAIAFREARTRESEQEVEVYATDVRNSALLEASQARYRSVSLRELSEEMRNRYFELSSGLSRKISGEFYTVIPDIRRVVIFRRVNLLDRLFWKGVAGRFDLIVCANQLAYLHGTAARQMSSNLINSLRVGGYLMVAPREEKLINSSRVMQHISFPTFFRRLI
jgi:chemotaxis methyl-accepting protein methylase